MTAMSSRLNRFTVHTHACSDNLKAAEKRIAALIDPVPSNASTNHTRHSPRSLSHPHFSGAPATNQTAGESSRSMRNTSAHAPPHSRRHECQCQTMQSEHAHFEKLVKCILKQNHIAYSRVLGINDTTHRLSLPVKPLRTRDRWTPSVMPRGC